MVEAETCTAPVTAPPQISGESCLTGKRPPAPTDQFCTESTILGTNPKPGRETFDPIVPDEPRPIESPEESRPNELSCKCGLSESALAATQTLDSEGL